MKMGRFGQIRNLPQDADCTDELSDCAHTCTVQYMRGRSFKGRIWHSSGIEVDWEVPRLSLPAPSLPICIDNSKQNPEP